MLFRSRTTQGDQLHHRRCLVTGQSRTFGPSQWAGLQRPRAARAIRLDSLIDGRARHAKDAHRLRRSHALLDDRVDHTPPQSFLGLRGKHPSIILVCTHASLDAATPTYVHYFML